MRFCVLFFVYIMEISVYVLLIIQCVSFFFFLCSFMHFILILVHFFTWMAGSNGTDPPAASASSDHIASKASSSGGISWTWASCSPEPEAELEPVRQWEWAILPLFRCRRSADSVGNPRPQPWHTNTGSSSLDSESSCRWPGRVWVRCSMRGTRD